LANNIEEKVRIISYCVGWCVFIILILGAIFVQPDSVRASSIQYIQPLKGLAMAAPEFPQDRLALNTKWWYVWNVNKEYLSDSSYVPMLRTGLETDLPEDYSGYVLLFNEWDAPEPNGIAISTHEAFLRYRMLLMKYPKAQFIPGGNSAWRYKDLINFQKECISAGIPVPKIMHIHAYVYRSYGYSPAKIQSFLNSLHQSLPDTVFWVSEYGVPNADYRTIDDFKSMTNFFTAKPWITRYAAYTNRQIGAKNWQIGHGCDLIDSKSGQFTIVGSYYANFDMLSVHHEF
jgi:hypothetical protein